jgi:hypothetical protein
VQWWSQTPITIHSPTQKVYLAWIAVILRQAGTPTDSEPLPSSTQAGGGGILYQASAAGAPFREWVICKYGACSQPRCVLAPSMSSSRFESDFRVFRICFEPYQSKEMVEYEGGIPSSKACGLNRNYAVEVYGKIVCRASPPSFIRAVSGCIQLLRNSDNPLIRS